MATQTHNSPAMGMGSGSREITEVVAYLQTVMVNVVFSGLPGGEWVLIDAGIQGSAGKIAREAERRFGRGPSAIVLTHGHFDHVGALETLARQWDVPVYAHVLEYPY